MGALPGQSTAAAPEPCSPEFAWSASSRHSPADRFAVLWGLWPANVCQLSEQVESLLWVCTEETRGLGLLRIGSRRDRRSGGSAGSQSLGASIPGIEPESHAGCGTGTRPFAP